jgi:hypothetical protein
MSKLKTLFHIILHFFSLIFKLTLNMSEVTGGTSSVLNEASTVFEIEIDIPTV